MDGVTLGNDSAGNRGINLTTDTYINWFFKRAPGVFDVVCYTGTGINPNTIYHSLGVVPELLIAKSRTAVGDWYVFHTASGKYFKLNTTGASAGDLSPSVTSTSFNGAPAQVNNPGERAVAYLFATKAGISKVGSYTGNGSTQTINAGFTTGARFVLIKRTDSVGDWFVWDTVRGIVEGNDSRLSLNTTAEEVTNEDSIDADTSGFVVNQVAATSINVTSATYIFLAFA